ncbi:MAG TPA: hypothetical protein VLT82_06375 [Myxococcaceae bacterium]|nr:hypothetical protein [Myxococcaceae bacterium]
MRVEQVVSDRRKTCQPEHTDSGGALTRRLLFLLLGLLACCGPVGTEAPSVDVEVACEVDGLRVQLEREVAWFWDAGAPVSGKAACERFGVTLMQYRSIYEARWGVLSLETAGWVVRVRASTTLEDGRASGRTYLESRVVDLVQGAIFGFPHELHHVQLGSDSGDHHGWCIDFEPWEESVLRLSERDYLCCQESKGAVLLVRAE